MTLTEDFSSIELLDFFTELEDARLERRYNRKLCLRKNERIIGKSKKVFHKKEIRSWRSMTNCQNFSKA